MQNVTVARITDPDRIRNYLTDESAAFHGRATQVFLPANEAELAEVVRAANQSHTPLTISAGGTSITGSRVPVHGGAVLSVERMTAPEGTPKPGFEAANGPDFAIFLNRTEKTAIVPPAITLSALDRILARFGLLYPPDPTEMSAMMGGTVATNASGARSFHYGPTRAWVRRLRVVLPTGEVADLRRAEHQPRVPGVLRFDAGNRAVVVPIPSLADYTMPDTKNAAGLYLKSGMDPVDLFIGCEGILGIIREVEVALIGRIHKTLTVVAYFGARTDALDFVDAGVTGRGAFDFLSLEYFDRRSLDFMRGRYPDIPAGAAAAVLFELPYGELKEHNPYPVNHMVSRLRETLEEHRSVSHWAIPGSRREDVRLFRHALPEAVNQFVRRRAGKIGSDMAVPHQRFREMIDIYEREAAHSGVRFLMFGHIGDDHLHLNFLPENAHEANRAKLAYTKLARAAVALGGTISAEHGVGKKTIFDENGRSVPYLQALYGVRGLQVIANVKKALDPNRILNLGNMVPAEMLA